MDFVYLRYVPVNGAATEGSTAQIGLSDSVFKRRRNLAVCDVSTAYNCQLLSARLLLFFYFIP